jgi:hypothetical protein
MHTPLTKALTPHCMVNHHIFNVPNLDRIAQLSEYKLTYNSDAIQLYCTRSRTLAKT